MSYEMSKKEIVAFRKTIPANTSDVLAERIKADGTIEELRVRFYQGQQKALQVHIFVEHKGSKIEEMITYPSTSDGFLSGDDDYFIFPVSIPVAYDDYLKVAVKNTETQYPYSLSCDIVIDYLGGKNRVV